MSEELTALQKFPELMQKYYECMLLHERVPKMTEEGIKWVCLECTKEKDKNEN